MELKELLWPLVSGGFKIVMVLAAVELLLLYLRRLDKRVGFSWKTKIVPGIEDNAMASAIYFGLRFAGLAIGVGLAIS